MRRVSLSLSLQWHLQTRMKSSFSCWDSATQPMRAYHAMDGELEGGKLIFSCWVRRKCGVKENALFFS